ncbi:(Fe-S)-binding protein [Chitinophaga sp. sic0106]|uniref:(Fe-S)-binding protein n=1 Tax=Chitinophaga sp. sic0106 TaxID=2854785 RepID=UPI001C46C181|nr:(Fe-S)-binding protein [Chitinophaga sp. sic0106]MBV7532960.1 (Fe-S)-binding protein [Chitinophaga sp. sic0106]
MKVALFIPCYIDAIYPEAGIATYELLERFGLEVEYPLNQTCCGQPMANEGDQENSAAAEQLFVENFSGYEYIIGPAGSCVKHVRHHLDAIPQTTAVREVRTRTYELVEFLYDILKVEAFPWAYFRYKASLHNSCSSIRGLHIAQPSEHMAPYYNKSEELLKMVEGLDLVPLDRPDECCGFGGTFCVTDEAVSARMGLDKVHDYSRQGAEYVISPDMSCLMHQQGIARKAGIDMKFIHIAQVLNGGPF